MNLFPYQSTGAQWLATQPFALLADEMGLGKTAQAITACDMIGAMRILVLCPAIGRRNWAREFEQFSIFDRPASIVETKKDAIGPSIVITSYDLAANPAVHAQLMAIPWDALICDESHYLKSWKAKRSRAVWGPKCDRVDGLAGAAAVVYLLSGTPAPNYPNELWPMLRAAGAYTGDYWGFVRRFCTGFDNGLGRYCITGGKNVPKLRSLLEPLMLRRLKKDVMKDLPPIRITTLVVPGAPVDEDVWFPTWKGDCAERRQIFEQRDALTVLLRNVVDHKAETELKSTDTLMGLQPATTTVRRYIGLSKCQPVAEMAIEQLESGELKKLVIFCHHRDVIMDLANRLRKHNPLTLFGGTDPNKRDNHIRKFQTLDKYKVFIGQIQACGTSITLTAAHDVWMVEPSWVPAENAQAIMRVHRIGQTEPVLVRYIATDDPVDDKVQRILQRKTKLLLEIFDGE